MNYIVFDLEWNQCSNPNFENELLPFEIIEIGAVKMNSKFQIIDEFGSIIKPQVYKKLQKHIKDVLNYDEEYLKNGRHFDEVCKEFLDWCGEDYKFCTWGPLDLYYLQQNMDFYVMEPLPAPLYFYNAQEIFSEIYPQYGNCKLEKAVNELKIPIDKDRPFHSAINDAYYTGLVMAKAKIRNFADQYSVDYYNNPKTEEEEIFNKHRNFTEYVTREFDDKIVAMEDTKLTGLLCNKCNRKTLRKIKWFSNNSNNYLCVGKCWYHGYVMGKIKFRSTYDDKVFAIKRVQLIKKAEMEEIKERQNTLRQKRKERNKQQRLKAKQKKNDLK